jgi:hypothetical protein
VRINFRSFNLFLTLTVTGSLAALYQSRVLGGYVLRGSVFAGLQSFGATIPSVKVTLVFLLAGTGVVLFLARNLCFWCN